MIITNIDHVPGRKIIEVLGIVRGNVVGKGTVSEPLLASIKKALSSAISWGPKIVTGEDIGLPEEEEKPSEPAEKPVVYEGELEEYSDLLHGLREKALERMILNAEKEGAQAVINVHFDVTVIIMHAFEVCAYGTAVKLA